MLLKIHCNVEPCQCESEDTKCKAHPDDKLSFHTAMLFRLCFFALPPFFKEFLRYKLLGVVNILSHPAILLENLGDDSIRKNFDYEVLVIRCLSKEQFRVFLMLLTDFCMASQLLESKRISGTVTLSMISHLLC